MNEKVHDKTKHNIFGCKNQIVTNIIHIIIVVSHGNCYFALIGVFSRQTDIANPTEERWAKDRNSL